VKARIAAAFVFAAPALALAQMGGGMGGGMGGMGGMGGGAPPARGPMEDLIPEVDAAYAADAQKAYDHGEAMFQKREWLDAIAAFRLVTQRFSYNVTLAALSELRLADIAFERERFTEARGLYRNFVRFHPQHPRVDDAEFRIGLSAFRDIPGDTFIEPPSVERDQTEVKGALRELRGYLERRTEGPHAAEAREIVRQCEDKLASHELVVARFYAHEKKWKAVALRADNAVRDFPSSSLVPEALTLSVEAHVQTGTLDAARQSLETLEAMQPDKKLLARAAKALRSSGAKEE
jgi:outer membrane protein assembly factor BamD